MNKTKFFSSLLVVALVASASLFVSCKDYDDDIKNLQQQIDKKALISDLDALKQTVTANATSAQAAMTKAEEALRAAQAAQTTASAAVTKAQLDEAINAVKKTAEEAGTTAAQAVKDAAAAAKTAGDASQAAADAAAAAKAAQETADKAVKDAADAAAAALAAQNTAGAETGAKATATDALSKANDALQKIGDLDKTYVTASSLQQQLNDLKAEILGSEGQEGGAQGSVAAYKAAIEELYKAITSIELYASYSWNSETASVADQQYVGAYPDYMGRLVYYTGISSLDLGFFHGTIAEDSKFGDNEAYRTADKQIEYKKGADIKDGTTLIVRVNPVNADLSTATIKLINSLGENLDDIITVTSAERFDELITRGASINSGLWKLTLKVADGISEEKFNKAVKVYDEETDTYGPNIAFAVAVNNTAKSSEERYVASTFDITPNYQNYEPALAFGFEVNGVNVRNIRNRWGRFGTDYKVQAEHGEEITTNPELAWVTPTDKIQTPATAIVGKVGEDGANVEIDKNKYYTETRRNYHFVYADVNEPFVLSNFYGRNVNNALDYYYVVLDKGNAIESAPSEWNAWNSYTVEGLGVMTPADKKLTMKITSASAHGDVVGFRVYAVNRDGTLADPDGRAFYVFVGKAGEEFKSASANIVATKAQPNSQEMDVTGWFKANTSYSFSPYNENNENKNPRWYTDANNTESFSMDHATLTFYDKNGDVLYTSTPNYTFSVNGNVLKDAVKVVFTPNANIAGMLNDATYTIYIRQNETHAGDTQTLPYASLSITKVMPDKARTLEFRPKQEVTEGSGKFIAYMIPNENPWSAPWTTAFSDVSNARAQSNAYVAGTDAKDNGFKNLNNIFYNLDTYGDIEFIFANSLKDGNKIVDLVDGNKNGIVYGTPGNYYILDVHTDFIDGKTEHAVTTYTNYDAVSTYIEKTDAGEVVHYGETWSVKSDQKLTAIYACWHHAMHDIAFNNAVNLQWSAEGTTTTTGFNNINTKNSYNATYFGKKLDVLVANGWLTYVAGSAELNTKADGTGQINPYFKPTVSDTNITFTQTSVQVDANPTADHDEYLIMKFKDAFGHEVAVASKVKIKKATSNAPRF